MSDPEKNYVWIVKDSDGVIGVTPDLCAAENALRASYFEATGYTPEQLGDRLSFDLKFMQWVLMLDRRPLWSYTATKSDLL